MEKPIQNDGKTNDKTSIFNDLRQCNTTMDILFTSIECETCRSITSFLVFLTLIVFFVSLIKLYKKIAEIKKNPHVELYKKEDDFFDQTYTKKTN